MMTRILVLGDVHGANPNNRKKLLEIFSHVRFDFALQVGDLGWYADILQPLYFIPGNNEDFDQIEEVADGAYSNLHMIRSGEVLEKGGLRIAGLRGNYAPTQYEKSRSELRSDRRRHFVHEDVEKTLALDNVDVLLSHEIPHGLITRGRYDPGNKYLDQILRKLRPRFFFGGHHHQYVHRSLGETEAYVLAPATREYLVFRPEDSLIERYSVEGQLLETDQGLLAE